MATRLQGEITPFDNVTNFTDAFTSNVASGSLLVVSAARWRSGDTTAYIAGDLTKSAGTATIGTPVIEYTASPGSSHRVGLWSVLVTSGGSLTLQVANSGTASYGSMAMAEYSGTWDAARTEATNSGTGGTNPASSGNATSAGAAVFIGVFSSDSPTNNLITQDAAFSLIGEDEAGADRIEHSLIERIVATGTTDAAEWTIADSNWVAGVTVFKENSGGGPGAGSDASSVGMSELSANLIRVTIIEETS